MIRSLATSILLFAAAPGLWSAPALAWIALVPLLGAIDGQPPRRAAAMGFACGCAYHVMLVYWVVTALNRYGGLPLWVAVLALAALAAYMAAYTAAACALAAWLPRRLRIVVFPLAWVGLDYLRGKALTGFPWMDLGYTQAFHPALIQTAELTGHAGVTLHIVVANLIIHQIIANARAKRSGALPSASPYPAALLVVAALGLAAAQGYSLWRFHDLRTAVSRLPAAKIAVIQGNIDQSQKWRPRLQGATVDTYIGLSRQARAGGADLIVWPETALPFFPSENPLFALVSDEVARPPHTPLLTGTPFVERGPRGRPRYFNSALLLRRENGALVSQRYDKEHLVPFGEYVPLGRYLPAALRPLVATAGNFTPGESAAPLMAGDIRAGMLICFESIFPDLATARVLAGANLLVNITNDAWYGRSSAPYQQLAMTVFRAIETRRSLARAANTGVSALVDPLGRVLAKTAIFTRTHAAAVLPLAEGITVYAGVGRLFAPFCLALLSLLVLYGIFGRVGKY